MTRNIDISTSLFKDLDLERQSIGIIDMGYSEWKVSFQEIMGDVIEGTMEHGDERVLKTLKEMLNKVNDLVEYEYAIMNNKMGKIMFDFFSAVEDRNKVVSGLIIEKANKGFLGVYHGLVSQIDKLEKILPQYSDNHEGRVAMIE
jgi:hypothetical protein